jgi:hypothetical protein
MSVLIIGSVIQDKSLQIYISLLGQSMRKNIVRYDDNHILLSEQFSIRVMLIGSGFQDIPEKPGGHAGFSKLIL